MKSLIMLSVLFFGLTSFSADLPADKKALLEKQYDVIKSWASNPVIVKAVKDSNANPEGKEMSDEKWGKLAVTDTLARGLSKNPAAEEIKKLKTPATTEAFLNNAQGTKVAYLAKTTSWSHKGKPKHDNPMSGKNWMGTYDSKPDASTGKSQIQISVPVLDGGKAIGSLVVGFSIEDLK